MYLIINNNFFLIYQISKNIWINIKIYIYHLWSYFNRKNFINISIKVLLKRKQKMKEFYHCFNLSHGNSISYRDYVARIEFHDVLMGSSQ